MSYSHQHSELASPAAPCRLSFPWSEDAVAALRVGDGVLLTGTIFTARDAVHRRLAEGEEPPLDLRGAVIYHCGPVAVPETGGSWRVTAAGPTTSMREEPFMAGLLARFGWRAIIGKGGMGEATLQACRRHGCVYLHAVGGAARLLAETVRRVEAVAWAEHGLSEAIWQLQVAEFPAIVTMDSHGGSLHRQVRQRSRRHLRSLIEKHSGDTVDQ